MILPGVTLAEGGATIAVASSHATAIELCLFDGDTERRIPLTERTGDLWHGVIPGLTPGTRYGLRAHGPWAPEQGHRFNPAKLLLDPYALQIDRPFRLHPAMFGHRDPQALLPDDTDSAAVMPKAIVTAPPATTPDQPAQGPLTPWSRSVIYELHVRGFTMRHPEIPPEQRGTFAGLAHPAAIRHLTTLGVTAVELLPTASWIEERHLHALGLQNHWGYNSVGFLAPDPRLAPGGWAEIRACVAALAASGIETILDVVLNHTGEGDALGPTLSFRGLDNASYYRLQNGAYVNDTGCGNTLALDRPPMLDLAMDSLRAWARFGGVHGFRFDLATTLGRTPEGFAPNAPLLTAISQDPLLRSLKLIAEPWDIGPGGYQLGRFPPAWAEWNDRFRDDTRAFWKGSGALGDLATRLAGSADRFAARHRPSRGVNFITAHDGFTLADLVSHTHKHNAANGEANRDGTDNNLSWNNGTEGATDNPAIRAARTRDQRALLATLLLARGTPMLSMGSELGHSQGGNNNAYAQDNETTWLDWSKAETDLIAFTASLIAARHRHAALHDDHFLTGTPGETPLPDAAWFRPDGTPMQTEDWSGDAVALVLTTATSRVCLACNRGPTQTFTPPPPQDGQIWQTITDSDPPGTNPTGSPPSPDAPLAARSVRLLAEAAAPAGHRASPATPETLARLAAATGIAPDWWEVDGTHHQVSPDTLRALLTAMGLTVGSAGAARNALAEVATLRERQPMPAGKVARHGEAASLALALPEGQTPRRTALTIASADGTTRQHIVSATDGRIERRRAADGRPLTLWHIPLPPLPVGRHRLIRNDRPEQTCALTIAPPSCHLPPAFALGQRRFGLAAQLYSLRRAGDQGIGDFTTLARLATAAAHRGAATVALNPLHALFPTDRNRASPYHPSDRRFLDPILLDLATCDDGLPPPEAAFAPIPGRAVDYNLVWTRKQSVLQHRFADFQALCRRQPAHEAACAFTAYITAAGPALAGFAAFQALAEHHQGPWQSWPAALRDPARALQAADPERVAYHQYLQWQCDRQLARAATGSHLEIGLIRDLAVGSAPDGAEAWAQADRLAQGVSIGAPPDPFSAEGQVWSLPPPNPLTYASHGTEAFAELLTANLRHAGGLRIDHVMGLARLFWVPDGASGRDGAYVASPLTDLLGEVALASQQAHALIVGEDLGTVPDGLRAALTHDNILSYRVLFLEREGHGFAPQAGYPRRAMACVATHDLPTLVGWSRGSDIAERAALGLLSPSATAAAQAERAEERTALAHLLHTPTLDDPIALTVAAHAFVAGTAADLVMAQLDDLALEPTAVNLPGTDRERPNWRRQLAEPIPDLLDSTAARQVLQSFRDAGRTAPIEEQPAVLF